MTLGNWEKALDALDNIASDDPSTNIETDLISWHIMTGREHQRYGKTFFTLKSIEPIIQTKNVRGVFSTGKKISLRRLKMGDYDALLSKKELGIKDCIEKKSHDRDILQFTDKALNFLTESSNVYINETKQKRCFIIPEANSIFSSTDSHGCVDLMLKYFPEHFYGAEQTFLDISEEGICRFCKIMRNDALFLFFLENSNENGVIKIPHEGFIRLTSVIDKIAKKIPVSGVLAQNAYRSLMHREGKIELHAFIHRVNTSFTIDFRNKPISELDFYVKPGIGEEQKAFSGTTNFLLVRSLEIEKNSFYTLLEQCPSIPTYSRSHCSCDFDDVESFLCALAELKKTTIILDWKTSNTVNILPQADYSQLRLSGSESMGWFTLDGDLQIDQQKVLSLSNLLASIDNHVGDFIQLDENSYLQVTHDLLKKLQFLKATGKSKGDSILFNSASIPALSTILDTGLPAEWKKTFAKIDEIFKQKIPIPNSLKGQLRFYQEEGFRYLARLAGCRIGCCLADDMGLGKTIQLLTLLLREAMNGPALVVCPASLCSHWLQEAERFAPSLKTIIFPTDCREKTIKEAGKNTLILCSYGILQAESNLFASKIWHTVILDEAQAIKNYSAKRTQATKTLQSDIRIASTGTPVENHLDDLWSIFDFLNPGLLGSLSEFQSNFYLDGRPNPAIKKLISPLILRRVKDEVLDDLPSKVEITLSVEFTDEERTLYEYLRQQAVASLKNEEGNIAILAQLTKLRRCCCHPSLAEQKINIEGAKLNRLIELVDELHEAGHHALIFSQYVDFLQIIKKKMIERGYSFQYLDGSTSLKKRKEAVDNFQAGIGDFFLISLKAGGTGLNLTAANYVILTDPWWNPAVETQAADRVYRIGQNKSVTIYRLIISNSVEEKVLRLHDRKKQLSQDVLSGAEISEISSKELLSLIKD